METLHASFNHVTHNLNRRIVDRFGHELDIDIVLYVGLCNAAEWVTSINGRDVILLGIEKILELNWYDEDSMRGLIYHESGHIYHKQYGTFHQHSDNSNLNFIWQLCTEGLALYYEQILTDFQSDLPTMTRFDPKYFGDWADYCGKGDVGYYLGAKFVQSLSGKYSFEQLIKMEIGEIAQEFFRFAKENGVRDFSSSLRLRSGTGLGADKRIARRP